MFRHVSTCFDVFGRRQSDNPECTRRDCRLGQCVTTAMRSHESQLRRFGLGVVTRVSDTCAPESRLSCLRNSSLFRLSLTPVTMLHRRHVIRPSANVIDIWPDSESRLAMQCHGKLMAMPYDGSARHAAVDSRFSCCADVFEFRRHVPWLSVIALTCFDVFRHVLTCFDVSQLKFGLSFDCHDMTGTHFDRRAINRTSSRRKTSW